MKLFMEYTTLMNNYFITGTDTDVGKTVTAAILQLALTANYWKPIQSGPADCAIVQTLTKLHDKHFFPSQYTFRLSLSPDQAARQENKVIDLNACQIPHSDKPLIVEGAGGVYVPLNKHALMLDLIKQINFPVILVCRGTLGTINHSLLTIHALRQWNIPIKGVIFNGELNPDNQEAIETRGNVKTLLHIPFFTTLSETTVRQWVATHQQQILERLQ